MESNEVNEDEQEEMYVCDPVLTKEGVKEYTSYSLKGSRVLETLTRRYRDFDALRKKLVERWPGVFIPNIPHKKKVGNKGKRTVGLRIEMINRFLKKLSKLEYLFNSEEMEMFLQNTSNVPKTLDSLKSESYGELLKKYNSAFTNYDENFDEKAGIEEQEKFIKDLNNNHPRIKAFRQLVLQAKERYQSEQENYLAVINMLSVYEKETINNFVNNDENKLIFFNMKNIEICQGISDAQEKIINPYDRLYDAITEDYLDTEAMIESLETLKDLRETYNKLNKSFASKNIKLNELQAGKTSVKTFLKYKSKDKGINDLSYEKEKLEKDISDLEQVIKIATYNMQNEIQNFKTISLDKYYAELSRVEKDTEANASIFDNLWETVVKDKNISEFN